MERNARKSTLGHMSKLMATAALASTVACSKCGGSTGGGYGVVDPMPPPARCYGGGVVATARWVPKPGGGRWLEIDISSATALVGGFVYSTPRVTGGTLVEEPEPFPLATTASLGTVDASAVDSGMDGGKRRGDGGSTEAGVVTTTMDAGPSSTAIGTATRTWRIDPTAATVYLFFDVTCPSGPGTLSVSASFGKTASGGEELRTNVVEN